MVSFSKDTSAVPNAVSLSKTSGVVSLRKSQIYTVIARWGKRDYDLYLLVEYTDGHVEVVSCFGTTITPHKFSTSTRDGAVIHVSGDRATGNRGGTEDPQEIARITLNDKIRCVVPVVYSAKNSGIGSFRRYRVDVYVLPGNFNDIPTEPVEGAVVVEASKASRNPFVYTYVPCVVDNSNPSEPKLDLTQQRYSRMNSERRPTVCNGVVTMNNGEENAEKPRPHS